MFDCDCVHPLAFFSLFAMLFLFVTELAAHRRQQQQQQQQRLLAPHMAAESSSWRMSLRREPRFDVNDQRG